MALSAMQDASAAERVVDFVRALENIRHQNAIEYPESLIQHFGELRGGAMQQAEKERIVVAITREVQAVSRRLLDYEEINIQDVKIDIEDPETTEERRKALREAQGRIEKFQVACKGFLSGQPEDSGTQLACAQMIQLIAGLVTP